MNTDTSKPCAMNPAMELALCANFGSAAAWRADALQLMQLDGVHGAAVQLVFDRRAGSLNHRWLPEGADSLAPQTPDASVLLTLPIGSPTQAEQRLDQINWSAAYALYQTAVHQASEPLGAAQHQLGDAVLLDVRRAGMFVNAPTMIPNAQWRDPALVSAWAQAVPRDQAVVVYCIYGHEVGRTTAMRLRSVGVQARFLEGGIDAWQSAGLPLVHKPADSGEAR